MKIRCAILIPMENNDTPVEPFDAAALDEASQEFPRLKANSIKFLNLLKNMIGKPLNPYDKKVLKALDLVLETAEASGIMDEKEENIAGSN